MCKREYVGEITCRLRQGGTIKWFPGKIKKKVGKNYRVHFDDGDDLEVELREDTYGTDWRFQGTCCKVEYNEDIDCADPIFGLKAGIPAKENAQLHSSSSKVLTLPLEVGDDSDSQESKDSSESGQKADIVPEKNAETPRGKGKRKRASRSDDGAGSKYGIEGHNEGRCSRRQQNYLLPRRFKGSHWNETILLKLRMVSKLSSSFFECCAVVEPHLMGKKEGPCIVCNCCQAGITNLAFYVCPSPNFDDGHAAEVEAILRNERLYYITTKIFHFLLLLSSSPPLCLFSRPFFFIKIIKIKKNYSGVKNVDNAYYLRSGRGARVRIWKSYKSLGRSAFWSF